MSQPAHPEQNYPPPGRAERLLVLWLAATLFLCLFVALPTDYTSSFIPFRLAARSYLRTLGVEQYWRLFAGSWENPQLRIVATTNAGRELDVTELFMHRGFFYRYILDDRMEVFHIELARGPVPIFLESYANAVRHKLSSEVRAVRFERVRQRPGANEPVNIVAIATFQWSQGKAASQ